ncbi:MAG: hypothetical protein KGS61_15850 [Verrucomicrobia bacterium]|nr:hypothetical protein [Verrucomicrobiota bacterium]
MSKRLLCLLSTVVGLWGVLLAAHGQAAVEGRVKLRAVRTRFVVPRYQTKISGTIAPPDPPVAVVYLEGDFSRTPPTHAPAVVEMGQKDYEFRPGLLVVQRGTRVAFPNYDEDYHNVLSYSKAKEFDLGRYRKDETPPTVRFDKAGVVELGCEIHEHMSGVILVLDTPYFTRTDTNGVYRLDHLPAGHSTLKAWLDSRTVWQQPVVLPGGATVRVDFTGP